MCHFVSAIPLIPDKNKIVMKRMLHKSRIKFCASKTRKDTSANVIHRNLPVATSMKP